MEHGHDIDNHRDDGTVCTLKGGQLIVHKGHLCEGSSLVPHQGDTFCLWYRCGQGDVPAGEARTGDLSDVRCTSCIDVYRRDSMENE